MNKKNLEKLKMTINKIVSSENQNDLDKLFSEIKWQIDPLNIGRFIGNFRFTFLKNVYQIKSSSLKRFADIEKMRIDWVINESDYLSSSIFEKKRLYYALSHLIVYNAWLSNYYKRNLSVYHGMFLDIK